MHLNTDCHQPKKMKNVLSVIVVIFVELGLQTASLHSNLVLLKQITKMRQK